MFLKASFQSKCGFRMCASKLLIFMNRFDVLLKAYLLSKCGSTMFAWKNLAFMDRFDVCLKASFLSECRSTMTAWEPDQMKMSVISPGFYERLQIIMQSVKPREQEHPTFGLWYWVNFTISLFGATLNVSHPDTPPSPP